MVAREKEDPRPVFCDRLRNIGVTARPAGNVRALDNRSGRTARWWVVDVGEGVLIWEENEWLVDVAEGPVRQVLIWESYDDGGRAVGAEECGGTKADREIRYLVPDSRIEPSFPGYGREIHSVREKRFPIFGPVDGVRWEGRKNKSLLSMDWKEVPNPAFWAEVVNRLSEDNSIRSAIAEGKRDLIIRTDFRRGRGGWRDDGGGGYWVLTEGAWGDTGNYKFVVPKLVDEVRKRAPSRLRWDCFQAVAKHLLATSSVINE